MHRIALSDHADLRALRAENQRVARHQERRMRFLEIEMDLRIAARQQLAVGVVHVDLGEEGQRRRIDGVGGADQHAFHIVVGIGREIDRRGDAGHHFGAVAFRHVDINAQRLGLGHLEEFRGIGRGRARTRRRRGAAGGGRGPARRGDEIADIDPPRGHHPVEGRLHLLEGQRLLDAVDRRLGRRDVGHLHGDVGILVVGVLLRHGLGLEEMVVTGRGHLRESEVGLGLAEVGLRLPQLLLDDRRLDRGHELTSLDRGADIDQPALDVAADLRINRALHVGLHGPR